MSQSARMNRLASVAKVAVAFLLARVFVSILYEYRLYFPADFDAAFLTGREQTFVGLYRIAFYTHIISAPLSILFGSALMSSAGMKRFPRWHRLLGRMQVACVVLFVAPSGFVMATEALAGTVATVGFMFQAIATAGCAMIATVHAIKRNFAVHRKWASRCFVLLISPLLLRVVAGLAIVTNNETLLFFQLNAWLSWIIPVLTYELWIRCRRVLRTCGWISRLRWPLTKRFHKHNKAM